MPRKGLPRFVIFQPNQKEFHICLEVGAAFMRWSSLYPPTTDVRFSRELTKIADLPANKLPKKNIYDQGTFTVTKSDTKASAEKKIAEGIGKKTFAFTLDGKKLNGRFALKQTRKGATLHKFKDKYATEEDVLSGDLARTISTMIPGYDENKITLGPPARSRAKRPATREATPPEEEITTDKQISGTSYHFTFYTSGNEPGICMVTAAGGGVLVLKKTGARWVLLPPAKPSVLKKEKEFADHARALDKVLNG